MSHIAIPIPNTPGKQDIEISVTINGKQQQLHYRIELFYWEECRKPTFNRVECIRNLLSEYDDQWMLYYIGDPNDDFVPITFIRKEDWQLQRQMAGR